MQTRSKLLAFLVGGAASVLAATAAAMPLGLDDGPIMTHAEADPLRRVPLMRAPAPTSLWPPATGPRRHPVAPGFPPSWAGVSPHPAVISGAWSRPQPAAVGPLAAPQRWLASRGCDDTGRPATLRPSTTDSARTRHRTPRHRHHYQIDFRNGGLVVAPLATVPRQRLDWRWGLRLIGYGMPGHLQRVANARAGVCADRLEFRRGPITEWYEMKPSGLEQGFTLHRPPVPGASDVVLALAIGGDLRGEWARRNQSVGFLTASGEHALTYEALKAMDADGKPVPARLMLGPDRLGIQLRVGDATWPIVVDPLIAEPGEPLLDWIETEHVLTDTDGIVTVPVGWNRYFGDEAFSAQYRLDGHPILTRAVDAGEAQSGRAILEIDHGGVFELTVALCNADGCTESEPVWLTVADAESTHLNEHQFDVPLSADEVETLLAGVAERTAQLAAVYGALEPPLAPSPVALPWLAKEVGKAALSGIVRAGSYHAFDSVMAAVGLGGNAIGEQLDEMQASVDALNAEVAAMTRGIESLQDETVWQGFLNQHKDANTAANQIYANLGFVSGWIDAGVDVDREAWTTARANIAEALTALAGAKTNAAGGLADAKDGAVDQLMRAIPQRVATVQSYWPLVEEYRAYYRSAIASAFMALDLIEDYFDGSGTTRVMADDALAAGRRSVLAMYFYGVAPVLPDGGSATLDFAQLRGSVNGYAAAGFADEHTATRLAGSALQADMAAMARDYRPEHHNGITLEQFLRDAGVPTAFVLDVGGGWHGTSWQAVKKSNGMPHTGTPPSWEIKPLVGIIDGNAWLEQYVYYCPHPICFDSNSYVYGWNDSDITDAINQRRNWLRDNGDIDLGWGRFAVSRYGAVDLTDRLNQAGRAADFDEVAIQAAAFGKFRGGAH